MRPQLFFSASAIALLAAVGLASAQDKGAPSATQPPAQQTAPSDSSHAAGHDAQTGKPETGEIQKTQPHAGSGQTKSEAETSGGAATQRLDVPPSEPKR